MRLLADPIELFCRVCDKPGMYLNTGSFDAVWSFVEGFNSARDDGPLTGFREWLIATRGKWTNLPWFMLIRERVFPGSDPGSLPGPDEHRALRSALRAALVDFKKQRDDAGIASIMSDCERLFRRAYPRPDRASARSTKQTVKRRKARPRR